MKLDDCGLEAGEQLLVDCLKNIVLSAFTVDLEEIDLGRAALAPDVVYGTKGEGYFPAARGESRGFSEFFGGDETVDCLIAVRQSEVVHLPLDGRISVSILL